MGLWTKKCHVCKRRLNGTQVRPDGARWICLDCQLDKARDKADAKADRKRGRRR